MAERLTHLPRARESSGIQIPDRLILTQRCKRFTIVSTSTQVAVFIGALTRK